MNDLDLEELVRHLGGVAEHEEDPDLDEIIYREFDCDMDSFVAIVKALLPMAMAAESPLTKTAYQGFAVGNMFLMKQEIKP